MLNQSLAVCASVGICDVCEAFPLQLTGGESLTPGLPKAGDRHRVSKKGEQEERPVFLPHLCL